MTFCPQCGKPVAPADPFCTACGTTVVHAPAATAAAPGSTLVAPAQRPPGVAIIGGTMIVVGGLLLFIFLGGLYAPKLDPEAWSDLMRQGSEQVGIAPTELDPIIRGMFVGGAVVAALALMTGIGALFRRRWAWSLILVFMGLNALIAILLIPGAIAFGVLGIGVSALVIWYFLRPEVKAWFGRA